MEEVLRAGVKDLNGNLSLNSRQVRDGNSILVTSHDQVIVELRPPPQAEQRGRRKLGAMRGQIRMAADFDEWPTGFLDMMEGKTEE